MEIDVAAAVGLAMTELLLSNELGGAIAVELEEPVPVELNDAVPVELAAGVPVEDALGLKVALKLAVEDFKLNVAILRPR